jgi:hypothetical protein
MKWDRGAIKTRYYMGRLWKISTFENRIRVVKHYEKRDAIGKPWNYVRSAVYSKID